VTRLLVARLGGDTSTIPAQPEPPRERLRAEDRWLLARVAETAAATDRAYRQYRFHDAMERLYSTSWDLYCSQYIEMVKGRLGRDAAAGWTATTALDVLLRLLHPFMPFVTEESAQHLPGAADTLQHREWPQPPAWWSEGGADAAAVDNLMALVVALRARRQEAGVPAHEHLDLVVGEATSLPAPELRRLLESLMRVRVADAPPAGAAPLRVVAGGLEATLFVPRADTAKDRGRLLSQRDELSARIDRLLSRLEDPQFTERAPGAVVARERGKLEDAQRELVALERVIAE